MAPSRYGPFKYTPINRRPPLKWPNGARVALWVVTNIEFFALDKAMPGDSGERPKGDDVTPMVRHWSQRDYGNRVGVFRLMKVLSAHGIRSTVALNSDVCAQHPEIIEDCVKLDWEFMGHCRTNTERLNQVALDKERALISDVLKCIAEATGKRPLGWLGAGLEETWNTLDHLVAEGCIYVADWVNDDQPYTMHIGGKKIVSVPYSYELNDIPAIVRAKYTPGEFERMIKNQFDILYAEGAASGRVMAICLHPFIMGQPHRIGALERALAYVDEFDGVWKATGAEIAQHYLASGLDY